MKAIIILILVVAPIAQAEWYFDGGVFTGFGQVNPESGSKPLLGHYGLGVTGGYILGDYMFGGTTTYRMVEQYSKVSTSGNYQGTYLSPAAFSAALLYGNWYLKFDVTYYLGEYLFANKSRSGGTIKLTEPAGIKTSYFWGMTDDFFLAAHLEYLGFRKVNRSDGANESYWQNLTNIGVGIYYVML